MKHIRNFFLGIAATIIIVFFLVTSPIWGLAWFGEKFYAEVIQHEQKD